MTDMDYSCPHCGSEQSIAVSVLYRQGVGSYSGMSHSLSMGEGGPAMGASVTRGAYSSLLADELAPPQERNSLPGIAVGFGGAAVFGVLMLVGLSQGAFAAALLGFVCAAPLAYLGYSEIQKAVTFNRDVYPGLLATWEATSMCQRCGRIFTTV